MAASLETPSSSTHVRALPATRNKASAALEALRLACTKQFLLAPGTTARLNLAVDLLVLLATLLLYVMTSGQVLAAHAATLAWSTLAVMAAWTVTGKISRLYERTGRDLMEDLALVSLAMVAVAATLTILQYTAPATRMLPRAGELLIVLGPVVLLLRRLVFNHISSQEAPSGEVLVIGMGPLGRYTGEDLQKRGRRRVVGYLGLTGEGHPGALPASFLGEASELERILRTTPVSEVYLAGDPLRHGTELQAAITTCEKFGVSFALPASSFRLGRANPVERTAVSDGYLHFASVNASAHQMVLKRLFDLAVATCALVLLLPLFLGVALLIKLTSPGPVFFKQRRVGLNGRPFYMYKFRSMVANAEALKDQLAARNEQSGPVFKIKNDPRITPIGRILRKYSIDELPQLINVVRGEMSIVGPRPPVPSEVARYEAWQHRRLSVRPGLTCIWQVSGRNEISFDQWMYLDMQYIDHWSLTRDLNLILKTIPVVLTGRGAS